MFENNHDYALLHHLLLALRTIVISGVTRLSEHSPKSIKEGIIARCAQSLACYRKHCATPSSVGQLVLPESMKLLPLYANCLLRSDALSGGSIFDVRSRVDPTKGSVDDDNDCFAFVFRSRYVVRRSKLGYAGRPVRRRLHVSCDVVPSVAVSESAGFRRARRTLAVHHREAQRRFYIYIR